MDIAEKTILQPWLTHDRSVADAPTCNQAITLSIAAAIHSANLPAEL